MIIGGRAHITGLYIIAVSASRRSPPSRTNPATCDFSLRLVAAQRPGKVAVTAARRKLLTPECHASRSPARATRLTPGDSRSVLDRRLPGEALLLRGLRPGQHLPPREERRPRDRRDPRRLQVRGAAAPERQPAEPPR